MNLVGCGVAVSDAHSDVLHAADVVLTRSGGHGAVRELCDALTERLQDVCTVDATHTHDR
jgi:3-deoxy-D-manno-octulosonate 8-phosphate phosphatase KdsC-like HAD superfamily phosphatase